MAKKSSIEKNNRRKRMTVRFSAKRMELKATIMDKNAPFEQRFEAQLKLAKLPRNGSKTRIRNRCELTGRSRGYYRKFNMSRICLRELAGSGMLPGVVKASW
jgi:small subunit ribosomal protein S14